MKLAAILGSLLLFAAAIVSATPQDSVAPDTKPDIHSKDGFMPLLEDWHVTEKRTTASPDSREIIGIEELVLRSDDGCRGIIEKVEGVTTVKVANVEVCSLADTIAGQFHVHAAILLDGGKWAMGEFSTVYPKSSGTSFRVCLEDYFTKVEVCGVEVVITEEPDKVVFSLKK